MSSPRDPEPWTTPLRSTRGGDFSNLQNVGGVMSLARNSRILRWAGAVPLLFTFLFATCPNGREGHVFALKLWNIRITANTCS